MWTPEERLNYADAFVQVDQKTINLDFWQETFLKDTNKYSITLKSRRTGFSFAVALKGLVKAMDGQRRKYVRQFVSYNEDDAKEKINYVKEFYHSIPKKHQKKLVTESKTSMEFYDKGGKTTSRLISIACRPPRGRGGDIVFDEMGIYPANKANIIYTAGLPVIARGGCVEIGSTPLGKIGKFYDIFSQPDKFPEYTRYTIPWWFARELCTNVAEAVECAPQMETEDRVTVYGTGSIQTLFKSMLLEDFQQEFECTFVDSAMSYITLDLLDRNTPGLREGDRSRILDEGEDEEEIEVKVFRDADSLLLGYRPEFHGSLYLGYDVARYRDAAVIFVTGRLPNGKKLAVAEIEMRNKEYEYQLDQMRKILKRLPVVRSCMDRTGVGDSLCETLQKEFGETKVEGVYFSQESKEVLAIGVRTALEREEYLLHNDEKFRRQVHSIKRIATTGGHFRYDSKRDEDGHADSFWAWALANYAVTNTAVTANTTSFYEQRIKNKNKTVFQSSQESGLANSSAGMHIPKRGKSVNSVLKGLQNE